ncbi:hypothetical protein LIER_26417 [Lithospermum erythrorhizon]|uniref:Uncharacterized protein n=1 Tax=Lithospermum erythrorhizon TaxID=34254 RepID=A0AAV3RCI3_LITER
MRRERYKSARRKLFRGCHLASTKCIKQQIEVGSSPKRTGDDPDKNMCTLQVLEESPKKGKPHEEVQSVPFDEKVRLRSFG